MSVGRYRLTSFANGNKGYVCGGYDTNDGINHYSTVDVYYDTYETLYSAKIPITEGSTYTLNGESGTADVSKVLMFDSKVTGTIEYKKGELLLDPYYSIIYDKSLASDPEACLTYSGLCTGFTPMSNPFGSNCYEGSWREGNGTLFDAIEVGYVYSGTWTKQSKSAVPGNTSYNCFTRIPKIYQRVVDLGNNKVRLDMSLEPFDGATLHPAFIVDGVEKNHKYIGRYLAYRHSSSDTLRSRSGNTPTRTQTRATFRTSATNTGTGYNLAKYWDWDLLNKLYLFAFKNFDSQTALGPGYTSGSSVKTTGGTNGKSWMYSNGTNTAQMSFLGIEDYYGNAWWFIDDFYGTGGTYYAGSNSVPTDDTTNKVVIGTGLTTSAYPLTCKGGLNDFFLMDTTGGSATSGLCEQQLFDSGANIGRVGGYYESGNDTGMFYLNATISSDTSAATVGARLCYSD